MLKICVYAISKNEEAIVDRWVDSMGEANAICVLYTGSTDRTVEQLADRGVIVRQQIIDPWRFDVARNESMKLIPADADVCVCTDLDEVLQPGWRDKIEAVWKPGVTQQLRYTYIWSFDAHGRPGTMFMYEKIHAPGVFEWHHPVHEILRRTDGAAQWQVEEHPGIVLEHHPDPAKSRGDYLRLLEMSVREEPQNDRNAHYLGREYMFHGMYAKAILELKRHLELPSAQWKPERCASMRFISKCYLALGEIRKGMRWALRGIAECPELREPWVQGMRAAYAAEDWAGVVWMGARATSITRKSGSYVNEDTSWGAWPWDAMAYAEYCMGDLRKAREYTEKALEYEPENERLQGNLKFYR